MGVFKKGDTIEIMGQILFKIWYMIAILPFLVFLEGSERLADFLKKKNIYVHWDVWHSTVIVLFILLIILLLNGYSF